MENLNNGNLSPNLAAAVILSSCISINCGPDGRPIIKMIDSQTMARVITPEGETVYDSENSASGAIPDCECGMKKPYSLEIRKPGNPLFSLDISKGKNGGWYAAGKYLIGGLVTIMICDCGNGNLHLVDPSSYAAKINDIKSNACIDRGSDEVYIALKNSLPVNIFEKLPLVTLKKNKYLK